MMVSLLQMLTLKQPGMELSTKNLSKTSATENLSKDVLPVIVQKKQD
jgi:hypothetical protein